MPDLIEEQFEALFNVSYDGFWICDGDGYILRCNPAAEQINGVDGRNLVGLHISVLTERGVNDMSVTMEAIRLRRPVTIMQRAYITGKKLLVTASPIFDRRGDLVMVVVNDRDITELDNLRHALLENLASPDQCSTDQADADWERLSGKRVIGRSPAMARVMSSALHVAQFKTTVLITGQSGTGKGLLAQAIHKASEREDGPLIRVDCGAIPPSLFESEIFGYDPGAFTGARKTGKQGLFESANHGTLFLDEIGLVPFGIQHKLLRFLEDGVLVRVGSTRPVEVDVRLIAATNVDLETEVAAGKFRRDLYYRLSVVPIHMPPLKERMDDIPLLINHFLDVFGRRYGTERKMSAPAVEALMGYEWPGNVRELENLIERLVVMSEARVIEKVDLPSRIITAQRRLNLPEMVPGKDLKSLVRAFETAMVDRALQRHGTQREAARALGISQASVARKRSAGVFSNES